jgi:multicomponent Na+:H+ antiporter subunit D
VTSPGVWVILIPLLAGLAGFGVGGRAARIIGVTGSALTLIATLWLINYVWQQGTWLYNLGGWERPLGIALRADGLNTFLVAMTAFVGMGISIYAIHYFESDESTADNWLPGASFWPLWMLLWASLNALFLSNDIFNLYVGLELLTLASVSLIVLERERAAIVAGLRYLLAAFFGSLVYLLGVGLIYAEAGVLDVGMLRETELEGIAIQVAGGLMAAGLLLKAALFPMHFWLPAAHSSAPAPVSAALSALVVKAAFYLLVRLWFEVFQEAGSVPVEQVIGALGAIAIVAGSFQAIRQSRLKLMIAYSTVAQIGYLFLIVPLAGDWGEPGGLWRFEAWTGGLYHAIAHGFAKASMFLAVGVILKCCGHDRIWDLDGTAGRLPVIYLSFGVAGLSLTGLPPSGGFIGKWLMLSASLDSGQWWWAVVLLLGGLLTAGYVAIVLSHAIQHDPDVPVEPLPVPKLMTLSVFALAGISLLLGLRATEPLELLEIGSPVAIPALGE